MLAPSPDERVAELWRRLASDPSVLSGPGITVVSGDRVRITRPGWCGVVAIGDSAIVATPSTCRPAIELLVASNSSPEMLTDPAYVADVLGPLEAILGPADLQYGEVHEQRGLGSRGPFHFEDPLVQQALSAMPEDDKAEAGFEDETIEAIFVSTQGGQPVAVAGYRGWEQTVAHMGVITMPDARRAGHGRKVAVAAAGHGTTEGLVIQWRSLWSNDASRELGRSLGLVRCGRQLSFRLPGN